MTHDNLVALAVPLRAQRAADGDRAARASADAGWIVGAVGEPQLLGAFNARTLEAHDRVGVYRDDGVRLAQVHLNVPVGDEADMARRLAQDAGALRRIATDGSDRLVAQRHIARYGVTVRVSRDLAVVLAEWQAAAGVSAAVLVLLLAAMFGALALAQRAERRRAQRAADAAGAAGARRPAGGLGHLGRWGGARLQQRAGRDRRLRRDGAGQRRAGLAASAGISTS